VIGTVRLWNIAAGPGRPALLLGPAGRCTRFPSMRHRGDLMRHAIERARRRGHRAVLLVGDAPYYGRFGFTAQRHRRAPAARTLCARTVLLARELVPDALAGARGSCAQPAAANGNRLPPSLPACPATTRRLRRGAA